MASRLVAGSGMATVWPSSPSPRRSAGAVISPRAPPGSPPPGLGGRHRSIPRSTLPSPAAPSPPAGRQPAPAGPLPWDCPRRRRRRPGCTGEPGAYLARADDLARRSTLSRMPAAPSSAALTLAQVTCSPRRASRRWARASTLQPLGMWAPVDAGAPERRRHAGHVSWSARTSRSTISAGVSRARLGQPTAPARHACVISFVSRAPTAPGVSLLTTASLPPPAPRQTLARQPCRSGPQCYGGTERWRRGRRRWEGHLPAQVDDVAGRPNQAKGEPLHGRDQVNALPEVWVRGPPVRQYPWTPPPAAPASGSCTTTTGRRG